MKLYLLKPIDNITPNPWEPWYDKAFGFVVRAKNENQARQMAQEQAGDEDRNGSPWLSDQQSICVLLTATGKPEVIIRDFHAA